ncbi:TonB-dependent receptor [Gallaecimonas kandeliae]|uniref:TonB-dependent receptor n=1 Tax=Gallaecimonas kandeliae TaxID=3029055 RepID=UPI002648E088|nr:TonB-dependent receptor [Gallaecimonas kandeliae]WKE66251.1 TonB-dependent receptor [Gallaecimonas kandeliae]
MPLSPKPLALLIATLLSTAAFADDVEIIEVHGQQPGQQSGSTFDQLLGQGVDFSAAGGVSALPVLNGLMGDRVKVQLDGADISSACANQMNPPLSYVSGNQIGSAQVLAGVSPVSLGGDNIAGVINVTTLDPHFGGGDSLGWRQGYLSGGFKSVSSTKTLGLGAELASQDLSLKYDGAFEDADSYHDGKGDKVLDTLYRAQNHALTAAYRGEKQLLALKLSHQYIPFQGFPNQYMDMTKNRSFGANALYRRRFAAGELEARLNWHGVKHEMGFFTAEKPGTMPMETKGIDRGYQLHWTQPLAGGGTLKLGQEYFDFRLDDGWPAVPGSMMMGPNDYLNINGGKRQRIAAFAEQELALAAWQLNYGLRFEQVHTDTGPVQGYGSMMMAMDSAAAQAFNGRDRSKTDNLLDASLLASVQLDGEQQLQLGLARKNRAPNLYERYSWGRSPMASTMIGWFGDGNGYVGDINLKPETAYTASLKYQYQGADWQASLSPYYTRVQDFIDADVIGTLGSGAATRHQLQFTNVDARLYGLDAAAALTLASSQALGQWQLPAKAGYRHGERDGGGALYQLAPIQGSLALSQQFGSWTNKLEWAWSGRKHRVDARRLENETAGYGLLNLSSQWQAKALTLSLAVTNLLDRDYQLPLGGVNIAQYKQDKSQGFSQLKGQGRSVDLGLRYAF